MSAVICFCAALNLAFLFTMPALLGSLVARCVQDASYAYKKHIWTCAYAVILGAFCIFLMWEPDKGTSLWPHINVPTWMSTTLGIVSIAAGITSFLRRTAIIQGEIDKRAT